jgi:hypothetical protein
VLGKLLAKEAAQRLPDAAAVARELAAVAGQVPEGPRRPTSAPSPSQQTMFTAQPAGTEFVVVSFIFVTVDESDDGIDPAEVHAIAERHGATVDRFDDGSMLINLAGRGAVDAEAVRAAQCALALRAALPERAKMVLTTDVTPDATGVQEQTVDRGVLALASDVDEEEDGVIWLDALTADVLRQHFVVRGRGSRYQLGKRVTAR